MLFLALNLMAVARERSQGPLWYWVAFGVAVFIGAVTGGLYDLRSHVRR